MTSPPPPPLVTCRRGAEGKSCGWPPSAWHASATRCGRQWRELARCFGLRVNFNKLQITS